jgi:eukaryotic-like serine/threonine-protein kinase
MTTRTVRGYALTTKLGCDGSNPYFGVSPDGLPVFIRLTAAVVQDTKRADTVLEFLRRYRQLNHPSLIKVLDYWIEGQYLGLVTELADGGSLKKRRGEQRPVAARELISLFTPLAEATDTLRRHGLKHSEIEPANLLLRRGVPQLDVPRLQHGEFFVVAKWSYSAPEVWRNEESEYSDQYSLAASYGELRLGRPLFVDRPDGSSSFLKASLGREPDLGPLPEAEREVLSRALAKEPSQRHATCMSFVEGLDCAVGEEGR